MKTCRVCLCNFIANLPMQRVCGPVCALAYAKSVTGKAKKVAIVKERRADAVKLAKLKTRSQWAREAQAAFNLFIRERDAGLPCISCGRQHQGQWHAGHYLSVGARPELRFCESNVHKQCAPCNNNLSGNIVLYRLSLASRIGNAGVDWLEGPHPTRKYTVHELEAIKKEYVARAREFKKENA